MNLFLKFSKQTEITPATFQIIMLFTAEIEGRKIVPETLPSSKKNANFHTFLKKKKLCLKWEKNKLGCNEANLRIMPKRKLVL